MACLQIAKKYLLNQMKETINTLMLVHVYRQQVSRAKNKSHVTQIYSHMVQNLVSKEELTYSK